MNHVLEIFCIEEEKSNMKITRKCLAYLQDNTLTEEEVSLDYVTQLRDFFLLSYAIFY